MPAGGKLLFRPMNANIADPAHFAQRALAHAQMLARSSRGSATQAEAQAGEYVQSQLKSLGVTDTQRQPFLGERSLWLFIALVLGLALVGHAAFWLLRKPMGDLPAMSIAALSFGFSGYLIWCRFSLRDYPLRRVLPYAPSQNVIVKLPPAGETQHRLVLVAHLDSHRAVFWFASNFLVRIFAPFCIITVYGIFLAIPVYVLAILTHWQVFEWLGLFLACFHFLGWFTGVTADLGQYSPGANDNASSMGTVLALAERLKQQPLHNTEIWLAFTGCEETNGGGILTLIDQSGAQLKDSWFIDFEMVGIGDRISYIREEGNLGRVTIPQEIETLLKEVGQPFGLQPVQTPLVGASTECSLLLKHGFKAVCIIAHCSGTSIMPEWHRLTDTPDRLQVASLERVQALTWDLLQRFDQ
jgi:hypothetical protein